MPTWEFQESGATLSDSLSSSYVGIWITDDAADGNAAIANALAAAPLSVTVNGVALTKQVPSAEPMNDDQLWRVEIQYSNPEGGAAVSPPTPLPDTVGDSRLSLEIGTSEILLTQAIEQVSYGPDMGKAINVVDGKAEGVNIVIPQASWTERHYLALATMTNVYVNTLMDTVGTCNDAAFRGRLAEEVLLLSVTGQQRSTGNWDVDFSFGLSPEKQIEDANEILRTKQGWRYAWWSYSTEADEGEWRLLPRPDGLHIAQTYELADYSVLGIGTT